MKVLLPLIAKQPFIYFCEKYEVDKSSYTFRSNGKICSFTFEETKETQNLVSNLDSFFMTLGDSIAKNAADQERKKQAKKLKNLHTKLDAANNSLTDAVKEATELREQNDKITKSLDEMIGDLNKLRKYEDIEEKITEFYKDLKKRWPGKKTDQFINLLRNYL